LGCGRRCGCRASGPETEPRRPRVPLRSVSKRVLVVGGSGLVGEPIVRRLVETGAEVDIATRGNVPIAPDLATEVSAAKVDRNVPGALEDVVGSGVDALVDVIPYRDADALQLLRLEGKVGTVIAVSSAAVYADSDGRGLLEADSSERPVPIPESHPTIPSDDQSYSGRKAAIEELLLGQTAIPVTILRPGAIYGERDLASREWYFVKRVFDRRDKVVLAYDGASRFHHMAAENVAELVRLALEKPGTRVLNSGDEEARTVRQISETVAALMDHQWEEVLFSGPPTPEGVGDSPWTTPKPFILDLSAAREELGYRDVIGYEEALRRTCEWLERIAGSRSWQEVLPRAAEYYGGLFDYEAEDEFAARIKWS
jgi:nucleoside-diphosphate-sugar epimerase